MSVYRIPDLVPQSVSAIIVPPFWNRAQFLSFLVEHHGWTSGAEIGVAEGRTSAHLLACNPGLSMIAVDARQAWPDTYPDSFEDWKHDELAALAEANLAPFKDRCAILTAPSVEAAKAVPDSSLDFVFIDADHSEAACRADILAWLPKLKPEAWITGHDISWPTVRKAVDDLIPAYQIGPDVVWFRPVHPFSNWARWLFHG